MKILISTAPQPEAAKLARTLVEEQWVACVNLIPQVQSLYRWQGQICDETEVMMFMKTTDQMASATMKRIRQLHSYEVPEIICLDIDENASNSDYLKWINDNVMFRP